MDLNEKHKLNCNSTKFPAACFRFYTFDEELPFYQDQCVALKENEYFYRACAFGFGYQTCITPSAKRCSIYLPGNSNSSVEVYESCMIGCWQPLAANPVQVDTHFCDSYKLPSLNRVCKKFLLTDQSYATFSAGEDEFRWQASILEVAKLA